MPPLHATLTQAQHLCIPVPVDSSSASASAAHRRGLPKSQSHMEITSRCLQLILVVLLVSWWHIAHPLLPRLQRSYSYTVCTIQLPVFRNCSVPVKFLC